MLGYKSRQHGAVLQIHEEQLLSLNCWCVSQLKPPAALHAKRQEKWLFQGTALDPEVHSQCPVLKSS